MRALVEIMTKKGDRKERQRKRPPKQQRASKKLTYNSRCKVKLPPDFDEKGVEKLIRGYLDE